MSREQYEKLKQFHDAFNETENREMFSSLVDMLQKNEELEKQFFERVNNSHLVKYASDRLKSDKAFWIEQIEADKFSFQNPEYIARSIRSDQGFRLEKIEANKFSFLQDVSDVIRSDKKIGLLAVSKNGMALKYLGGSLKQDKEIVSEAVRQYGRSILEADTKFSDDKEIAAIAVSNDPSTLRYFSEGIQELCKGKDPVHALQSAIKMEKLQLHLKPKPQSESIRMKI